MDLDKIIIYCVECNVFRMKGEWPKSLAINVIMRNFYLPKERTKGMCPSCHSLYGFKEQYFPINISLSERKKYLNSLSFYEKSFSNFQ